MRKILPLLAGALLLTLAAAPPEEVPVSPVAVPPSLSIPAFRPAAGHYEVRMTGSNGAEITVTADGPADAEKLKAYGDAVRKETQREIHFELLWDETITPGESGTTVVRRVMISAKVERTVAGVIESGPLPIDYQDSALELTFNAAGALTGRKYTAPRLNPGEKEILEQFFDVEPFPDLPPTIAPGEMVERTRRQKISFESQETEQTTVDHYWAAGTSAPRDEKTAPPAGSVALRLERDIAIGGGGGLNPIRSVTPGRFQLVLGADGLLNGCSGKYELGFLEILPMPPELYPAVPESPPESTPGTVKKKASAAAPPAAKVDSSPAPAPPQEGKLKWDYRLPGTFSFSRRLVSLSPPVAVAAPAVPGVIPMSGDAALTEPKAAVGSSNAQSEAKDLQTPASAAVPASAAGPASVSGIPAPGSAPSPKAKAAAGKKRPGNRKAVGQSPYSAPSSAPASSPITAPPNPPRKAP